VKENGTTRHIGWQPKRFKRQGDALRALKKEQSDSEHCFNRHERRIPFAKPANVIEL
jgi:hypothetical protein